MMKRIISLLLVAAVVLAVLPFGALAASVPVSGNVIDITDLNLSNAVVGSTYISERFGNWAVALSMAGLPMPKKKRPRDTAVNAYLKRRQNAESQKVKII